MLNIVSKNSLWEVRVNKEHSELFCKKEEPTNDVIDFHDKIISSDNDWDVAFYKDMVAFKNPCERTTYIYHEDYWESRMSDSFWRLYICVFE